MSKSVFPAICPECQEQISPLGDEVREGGRHYHITCWLEPRRAYAISAGRQQILQEQEARRQSNESEKERVARVAFDALQRCGRCAVRMLTNSTVLQFKPEWGQVVPESSTRNVCAPCIRREITARQETLREPSIVPGTPMRTLPQPPPAVPAQESKKEEPKMGETEERFKRIEID